METKSWKDIKDTVYGVVGTERRDELERDSESFKIGLLMRARLMQLKMERYLRESHLGSNK